MQKVKHDNYFDQNFRIYKNLLLYKKLVAKTMRSVLTLSQLQKQFMVQWEAKNLVRWHYFWPMTREFCISWPRVNQSASCIFLLQNGNKGEYESIQNGRGWGRNDHIIVLFLHFNLLFSYSKLFVSTFVYKTLIYQKRK